MPLLPIEKKVIALFRKKGISKEASNKVFTYLEKLKNLHEPTYLHCIRTGLFCAEAERVLGMNSRGLFFSGLLHDIGKSDISIDILRKKGELTPEQFAEMKKHAEFGHKILEREFPFAAEIVLRHHSHQENNYPAQLPHPKNSFSEKQMAEIEHYSKVLSMIDSFDSMYFQHDGKKRKEQHDITKIRKALMKKYGGDRLVSTLFARGVFSLPTIFEMRVSEKSKKFKPKKVPSASIVQRKRALRRK
jgi:putative nucleotidyltransferase with HDIG domain